MANQVSNYKCPACTGPLHYDGASGRLQCDYCGSSFEVAEIEALYEKENAQAAQAAQEAENKTDAQQFDSEAEADEEPWEEAEDEWDISSANDRWGSEADNMRSYSCPSCGAELICDETTAATSCPYCDNPTIIPSSFAGALKPDAIIPFKLDKEAAKAGFREHLKGRKLLPKLFSTENHLDEIKGLYVPFWLFDVDAKADISYSGTQIRTWSDRKYNYTETRYYDLIRRGRIGFDNIPVDGSEKMDDKLMESLEPFDVSKMVDFKSAYLTGYFADRYDIMAEKCIGRAKDRVRRSTETSFASTTAGYMGVVPMHSNINITSGKGRYVLYPVWLLNTTWRDKRYVFAMNGQTGKFVGNLPVDKGLAWKWRLIYGGAASAVLLLLTTLMQFM